MLEGVARLVKQEALDCIKMLPDTADCNDILYSLYVIQKIERGQQEARDRAGISIEEARKMLGVA